MHAANRYSQLYAGGAAAEGAENPELPRRVSTVQSKEICARKLYASGWRLRRSLYDNEPAAWMRSCHPAARSTVDSVLQLRASKYVGREHAPHMKERMRDSCWPSRVTVLKSGQPGTIDGDSV